MIGYLEGKVTHLFMDYCFLNVHGVGYRVFVSGATRSVLRVGEAATLFTHLHVREDAMLLYGFAKEEEYELFQQLISVSSIGTKTALGILSSITVEGFCRAIASKQMSVLTKLPGVGKKSAERLILELKDKLAYTETEADEAETEILTPVGDLRREAEGALLALGYTQAEIAPALKKVKKEATVEAMLKAALRELSKG